MSHSPGFDHPMQCVPSAHQQRKQTREFASVTHQRTHTLHVHNGLTHNDTAPCDSSAEFVANNCNLDAWCSTA